MALRLRTRQTRLRVKNERNEGYISLPKAIREQLGLNEGDELVVEVRNDGEIVLRPVRKSPKPDIERHKESMREHVERLKKIQGRREPKPGELAEVYLEEEFED